METIEEKDIKKDDDNQQVEQEQEILDYLNDINIFGV